MKTIILKPGKTISENLIQKTEQMKKILSIIYIAFLVLAFTSCEDFLTITPEDSLTVESYYTSEDAINANTASLYSGKTWSEFHMNFMWMAGDELAGDLYYTYDQEGQFYYMTFNNGNTYLTQGWNGLYRVVSYCNNIINDMPSAASANGVDEEYIERGVAEARCIRGIAYYLLTEYWEDVPIITNNNISGDQVVCYLQSSVYEFIRRDLEAAAEVLPSAPFEEGRVSKYTAIGMLAKLHLTMASHLDDSESAANFELAKTYAKQVIDESSYSLYDDYETMYYPAGNNNSESIFAIQCTTDGYGYGNSRNVAQSRGALITLGSSWGGAKGPTLSLQDEFESKDLRRYYTFMRNGDSYDNLGGGGYDYYNYSEDGTTETYNVMLAHIRKYIIGANADCDNMAGASNQDAGNNLYILRLADVYLTYVEACIGSGSSTSDEDALTYFKAIRNRAGLDWDEASISFTQLLHERRVEFAFESINFFDIKRYSYRDMTATLAYLNDMEREKQYLANTGNYTTEQLNDPTAYHGGFTVIEPGNGETGSFFYYHPSVATITVDEDNLTLPIPAETITKTPSITADPIEYDFNE